MANIVPIFGVIFFGWDLFQIIFLYWLESAVIGMYNIFKIIVKERFFSSILSVPLFILHFGGFMIGHLAAINSIFAPHQLSEDSSFLEHDAFVQLCRSVALPAIILVLSHGISFYTNFLGKKEYKHMESGALWSAPYKRVLIMHFTIMLSAFFVIGLQTPVFGLLLLIIIKIIADLRSHKKEHSGSYL